MATITISVTTEAHEILAKLKKGGQSFSEVIMENLGPKPRSCGELLQELERDFEGRRLFDPKRLDRIRAGRGRGSNRPPANH